MAKKVNLQQSLNINNASLLNDASRAMAVRSEQIIWIPADKVHPHPAEEEIYDVSDLDTLVEDIALRGIQTPLKVIARDDGEYVVIGGHRRRAANALAMERHPEYREKGQMLPCIIKPNYQPGHEYEEIEDMILDNLQRDKSDYDRVRETVMYHTCLMRKKKAENPELKVRETISQRLGRSDSEITRHLSIINDLLPELLVYFKEGLIAQTVAAIIAKKDIAFQEFLLKKWDKKTKLALRTVNIIEDMYLSDENNEVEDGSISGNPNVSNDDNEDVAPVKEESTNVSAPPAEDGVVPADVIVEDEETASNDGSDAESLEVESESHENDVVASESDKIRKERLQDINEGLQKMNTSIERINHFLDPDNVVDLKTRERGKILKQIERQMLALQSLCDILEEITESRTRD